jgi:ABC-type nitrate/sulfonate/bicarbonate transport system substrate-binding protein
MTKRIKVLLALLAAVVAYASGAADQILPLVEQVIAAFGEEQNPDHLPLLPTGFAGSLADDDGGV